MATELKTDVPGTPWTTWEPLPQGEYKARVTEIGYDVTGNFGPQYRFDFVVEEGEFEGNLIRTWASAKCSPKSKLGKWCLKFVPLEYLKEHGFTPDLLMGRLVHVSVLVEDREDGDGQRNRVNGLRPYKTPGQEVLLPDN